MHRCLYMLILDPETHTYTDESGRVYPGVTQVIKAAGLYGNALDFIDPWYRERGKAIHEATALFDIGVLDWQSLDPRIFPFMDAWVTYREQTSPGPYDFIEKSFSHLTYGYAGTLDRPGLDIKCGGPMPAYILQAAAYANLSGATCKEWKTVYLQDDGRYKVTIYKVSELYAAFKVFLAALTVYDWKLQEDVK